MANDQAIAATSKALIELLTAEWEAAALSPLGPPPTFALAHSSDLEQQNASPPAAVKEATKYGATLLLYQVTVNGTMRPAPRQVRSDGQVYRGPLMLDLHYLLTVWADDVEKQQLLLGWCMRVLHDMPILPATHLNKYGAVFEENEAVELVPEALAFADYLAVWDKLKTRLQTSATYIARRVALDSRRRVPQGKPVQTREFVFDEAR